MLTHLSEYIIIYIIAIIAMFQLAEINPARPEQKSI